jgi:hypothetical protein
MAGSGFCGMTIIPFLRSAETITSIATSVAVIVFSFAAYRRTKLLPFALWIASCSISIILVVASYDHSTLPPASHEDEMKFQVFYRVGFIICSILGAAGSVMLIQYLMAKLDSESPPKIPPDSK